MTLKLLWRFDAEDSGTNKLEEVMRGLETKESPILFGLHPNFLRPDCREIMRVQKQIISHDMLTHSALLAARTHKPHKSERVCVQEKMCAFTRASTLLS